MSAYLLSGYAGILYLFVDFYEQEENKETKKK
jgi:hypothetical protein